MYSEINEIERVVSKVMDEKLESFFNKLLGKKKGEINNEMTAKEVCDYLKISKVTLYNWVKKRKIASKKVGNARVFDRNYIEVYAISSKQYVYNKW